MTIFGKHNSAENIKHNFSKIISQPSSVLIFCSEDFVEFMESLCGLGILLEYYTDPVIVLYSKEWEFFVTKLYPHKTITPVSLSELINDNRLQPFELTIFLTKNIHKSHRALLKKEQASVLTGMSSFDDEKLLNCFISVDDSQSYYLQFFSFACQITGSTQDWKTYTTSYTYNATKKDSSNKKSIYIDISPNLHNRRISKKNIYTLVNTLQKDFSCSISLVDSDAQYYKKLKSENFTVKPDLQQMEKYRDIFRISEYCTLYISVNTPYLHCMHYLSNNTFSILTKHERQHHCNFLNNTTYTIDYFSLLKIQTIISNIKNVLENINR